MAEEQKKVDGVSNVAWDLVEDDDDEEDDDFEFGKTADTPSPVVTRDNQQESEQTE